MFKPEQLLAARKRLKLTQGEMAGFIGLSKRAYSDLETGNTPIRGLHMLAADQVSLMLAAQQKDPSMVPPHFRKEILMLAKDLVEAGLDSHQIE